MFFYLMLLVGATSYVGFYKATKDALNPFAISLLMLCFSSGVSSLCLSFLQQKWNFEMYTVIVLAIASIALAGLVSLSKLKSEKTKQQRIVFSNFYNFAFKAICIISVICALLEWQKQNFTMPGFTINSGFDVKTEIQSISFIHYGTIFLPYCALAAVFEMLYSKFYKKTLIFNILIVAFALFHSYAIIISRGTLLIIALGSIYLLYRKFNITIKQLILFVLIVLSGFLFIATIRIGESSLVFTLTDASSLFNSLYSYIALGYENLYKLILGGSPYSIFVCTLAPVLRIMGLQNYFPREQYTTAFFNADTFLYGFYHDLGIVGVIAFTFILFYLIGKIYKKSITDVRYILLIAALQKAIYCLYAGNYFNSDLVIVFPYIVIGILIWTLKIKIIHAGYPASVNLAITQQKR